MPNITLYVSEADLPVVKRAMKLAAFHDDKSLSRVMVEKSQEIVNKYDGRKISNDPK